MHGLINRAIEVFVRDTYGSERWEAIVRKARLEFSEFEAMLSYEIDITLSVLNAASEVLEQPSSEMLEDLGTYLVSNPNAEALRRLLRFGGVDFVEFLHSLDELPDRARLAVSDLELPPMEVRQISAERFSLVCQAGPVCFGNVLMGVLRAMADDYGALVILEYQGRSNGVETISIQLVESEFAEGRSFELAVRSS